MSTPLYPSLVAGPSLDVTVTVVDDAFFEATWRSRHPTIEDHDPGDEDPIESTIRALIRLCPSSWPVDDIASTIRSRLMIPKPP